MLEMLDVLIGFTVIMLIMSMAVTMLTQLFGTMILDLRGRALRIGTARLLALLDRGLTPTESMAIANHILRNPLIGQPPVLFGSHGLAPVVHREELVKLILDFAANGDAERAHDQETVDEDGLRDKIRRSLAANGIADPEAVLGKIRTALLELEQSNPEMSHSARLNVAILRFAASDFLAKLNSWFDQTIDRVSDIFTTRIRIVTAVVAILVAFTVHLDAFALINRLSTDDALRDRLVASAIERVEQTEAAASAGRAQQGSTADAPSPGGPPPSTADDSTAAPPGEGAANETAGADSAASQSGDSGPATSNPPARASQTRTVSDQQAAVDIRRRLQEIRESGVDELEGFGLISLPRSYQDWASRWSSNGGPPSPSELFMRLLGILLSAALLSLGAPFWYSALRDLVKLRSVVASKDDSERAERQSTQATALNPQPLPPVARPRRRRTPAAN